MSLFTPVPLANAVVLAIATLLLLFSPVEISAIGRGLVER